MRWLADMVYIQMLWIVYMLLGIVVAGFFPSTIAMYTVIRNYLFYDKKNLIGRQFKEAYKTNFKRANLFGYLSLTIYICLILYFRMSVNIGNQFAFIFVGLAFTLLVLYSIVSLYFFPIYVHFDLTFIEIYKHAILIAILSPVTTLTLIALVIIFTLTFVRWMILVPIISIAILSYFIMFFTLKAFNKLKNGGK